MRFDDDVTIDAAADHVWQIYSDVERWPEWTASVRSVEYEQGDTLTPGSRVRIRQPKLPAAVWEVQEVEPGRTWTWVAHAPGVRTTAVHTVEAVDDHRTRVRQAIVQEGAVAAIAGRVYARLTRRYLSMEARGLKERCEA